MGIGDKGILSVGTDMSDVTVKMLQEMVDDDVEFAALAKVFSELTDEETEVTFS